MSDTFSVIDSDPQVSHVEEVRKQRARNIVRSVLTKGLLSTNSQQREGIDSVKSYISQEDHISGRLIIPLTASFADAHVASVHKTESRETLTVEVNGFKHEEWLSQGSHREVGERLLQNVLYGDNDFASPLYAVLPVLAERKEGTTLHVANERLEDRVLNSVLVVVPSNQIKLEDYANNGAPDVQLVHSVKAGTILIPEGLKEDLGESVKEFGGQIRFVDNVKKTIFNHPTGNEITVPDYEGALRSLLEETNEPLYVHGVRLPTIEDVTSGRIG